MWLLHKTYIDHSEMFASDAMPEGQGQRHEDEPEVDSESNGYHLQERIQTWLLEEPREETNALREMQAGSALRAHQSMLCYWRSADGELVDGEDGYADSGESIPRESFFGVVEMAQKDSHFYLDQLKGGVVRAVQVNVEDARW